MTVGELLAAAGEAGTDLTGLINLGAVGVIAAFLLVFAKGAHQDLRDRLTARDAELKEAHAEVKRLNDLIHETSLTALRETQEALVRSTDVLRDVVEEERATRRRPSGGGR